MSTTQIEKMAFYFGAWSKTRLGHYLYKPDETVIWNPKRDLKGIPWGEGLMDAGLLKNGRRRDIVDGKVFWTCGGADINYLWHAFIWWDRSADSRGNSNSGFYTFGFPGKGGQHDAFTYACEQFPQIVQRQSFPLDLQP